MKKNKHETVARKKSFYKKWWVWLIFIFLLAGFANLLTEDDNNGSKATVNKQETKKKDTEKNDYDKKNSEVIEAKDEKSRASVIAEKSIKKLYSIDNFKINFTDSSFKVFQMPDDKNIETGQEYKNIYSVIGDYTWQDKLYKFSMLYSMSDEDNYTVLSLTSNIDNAISIDIPIESDK